MPKLLPQAISVPRDPNQSNVQDQTQPTLLVPGQKFIPHRQFRTGVFMPDVILANRCLSGGAKLLWARLARYAGVNGVCFPSCETLGVDLGCSPRQVQRYVAELVKAGFIAARQRGFNKSNTYTFLWHPDLDEPPRKGPLSATDLSHCSTSDLSSGVSASDLSSSVSATDPACLNEVKRKKEEQAERTAAGVASCIDVEASACPSHRKQRVAPLTRQESEVMCWLQLFQKDLRIGGCVDSGTVREVLKVVLPGDIGRALQFVAGKVEERRRGDRHYRERVDFGFVLTILRDDYQRQCQDMPSLTQGPVPAASPGSGAVLRPVRCRWTATRGFGGALVMGSLARVRLPDAPACFATSISCHPLGTRAYEGRHTENSRTELAATPSPGCRETPARPAASRYHLCRP